MTRKKHGAILGILALLTAFANPGVNSDYRLPVEVSIPIGADSRSPCNIMCWNCEGGRHYDRGTNVPVYQWRADIPHQSGVCGAQNTCQGAGHTEDCEFGGRGGTFANTGENYEAVRNVIATGELTDVAAALDSDWVSYVAERRSIQVRSCAGSIIANLPVRPEWAMVLGGVDGLGAVSTP